LDFPGPTGFCGFGSLKKKVAAEQETLPTRQVTKPNESTTVAPPQTARQQVICLAFESEAQ
jgi:hypothetical protein